LNESTAIARRLSAIGFDAIETSGAMWEVCMRRKEELGWLPAFNPESRVDILSEDMEAYYLPYAKEIKQIIDKPLILVGGIRSMNVAEQILADGNADFIAMCRPLIRDPKLPKKWLEGLDTTPSSCISCNECTASTMIGKLRCGLSEP
jgi:2,4-dienoyl-CoA reductase-like NADH-dependent reductase (Old Yellow Enzyme family)